MAILGQLSGDPHMAAAGSLPLKYRDRIIPLGSGFYAQGGTINRIPGYKEALEEKFRRDLATRRQGMAEEMEMFKAKEEYKGARKREKAASELSPTAELATEVRQDLEDLQAEGGNIGKPWVDVPAGIAEDLGMEQAAEWARNLGYSGEEQRVLASAALNFQTMFSALQKGAASDRDLLMMRRLDPTKPGLTMDRRVQNAKLAEQHYDRVMRGLTGSPGETPKTSSGPGMPQGWTVREK